VLLIVHPDSQLSLYRHALAEMSDEEFVGQAKDDRPLLTRFLKSNQVLPPIRTEVSQLQDNLAVEDVLKLEDLVALREAHEIRQAKTGIRRVRQHHTNTQDTSLPEANSHPEELSPSQRYQKLRSGIYREIAQVIGEKEMKAIGTGLERSARWQKNAAKSGNAANAAETANRQAQKVEFSCYGLRQC
jgi:hypothetical protein